MIESTTKHETLARAGITIAVALAWCFFAYVAYAAPESGDTVLNIAELDLSKPASAAVLYKRIKGAAAICAGCRKSARQLAASATRRARLLREVPY